MRRGRPITNPTEGAARRRKQQRLYRRANPQGANCPRCGRRKSLYAKHCRPCAGVVRRASVKRTPQASYMRGYMRERRGQRLEVDHINDLRHRSVDLKLCVAAFCMYAGFEHHHCECGFVLAPSEHACPICIAEQSRIEFKVWPKESAA